MTDIEKESFLRKCFDIKAELGLPPHFLKAYNVFEHMLGLGANGGTVPEGLMALYHSAKGKNDTVRAGNELSLDLMVMLAAVHQMFCGSERSVEMPKRRGRPPKNPVTEAACV
ncbi:MAG: hypothetical protein V3S68_00250 [Dehalococcoidia bacterium]